MLVDGLGQFHQNNVKVNSSAEFSQLITVNRNLLFLQQLIRIELFVIFLMNFDEVCSDSL